MSKLETAKEQYDETTEAIRKSACAMVDTAREANDKITEATGKLRNGTDKLAGALDKLMRSVGSKDLGQLVEQAQSLADALERLAALEEKGVLDKVVKAMRP